MNILSLQKVAKYLRKGFCKHAPREYIKDKYGVLHYPAHGMRGFYMKRSDIFHNGIQSGEGIILDGVVFPDNSVAVRWTGIKNKVKSMTFFRTWEEFKKTHLHANSEIVWLNAASLCTTNEYASQIRIEELVCLIRRIAKEMRMGKLEENKAVGKIVSLVVSETEEAFQSGWGQATACERIKAIQDKLDSPSKDE